MDMQSSLIAGGVIFGIALVIGTISFLSSRTQSFEELRAERRANLPGGLIPKVKDKKPKPKSKRASSKKQKMEVKPFDFSPEDDEAVTPQPEWEETQSDTHHHEDHVDHVDFKEEDDIIILDEDHTRYLNQRRVSSSEPKKPILVHKSSRSDLTGDLPCPVIGPVKGNKFELVHPKDDFELASSSRRATPTPPPTVTQVTIPITVAPLTNGHREPDVLVVAPQPQAKKSKKTSKSGIKESQSLNDISLSMLDAAKLMELIRSAPLNDAETQAIVNELLNKDGDHEWVNKDDPMAQLKKQLGETEVTLKIERSNGEQERARVRELMHDLKEEKIRCKHLTDTVNKNQNDMTRMQVIIAEMKDSHASDLIKMKTRALDEVNTGFTRLQEENQQLKQMLTQKEQESEKVILLQNEVKKLKIEQSNHLKALSQAEVALNQTKATLEQTKAALDQTTVSMSQLQDRVKGDAFSFSNQVNDLTRKLSEANDQIVSTSNMSNKELSRLANKVEDLTQQKSLLEQSATQANQRKNRSEDEIKELKQQLMSLSGDKDIVVQDLKRQIDLLTQQAADQDRVLHLKEEELNKLQHQVVIFKERESSVELAIGHLKSELNQLKSDSNKVAPEVATLKESLADVTLHHQQVIGYITSSFPEIKVSEHKDGVKDALDIIFKQLRSQTAAALESLSAEKARADEVEVSLKSFPTSSKVMDEADQEVMQLKTSNQELTRQVSVLQSSLKSTDDALKKIEESALKEAEFHQREMASLKGQCDLLLSEKKAMDNTLTDMGSMRESVQEMEAKLKDLQSKLQGEESNKKDMTKKINEMSTMLSKANQELSLLEEDRKNLDTMKAAMEDMATTLTKEKEDFKKVHLQNIKLKSLVEIGLQSVKTEMAKNEQLEQQLKSNSGSGPAAALSTPCLSSINGSTVTNGSAANGNSDTLKNGKSTKASSKSNTSLNRS